MADITLADLVASSNSWRASVGAPKAAAAAPAPLPAAGLTLQDLINSSKSFLNSLGGKKPAPAQPASIAPAAAPSAPAADRAAALIRGMTHTESRDRQLDASGQPITSSKGAIGIAQVMPGTAPEAARLAGLPFDRNRYMFDKDYNLALGAAYLKEQISKFGGDEAKGIAAYNTGARRVREAVDRAHGAGNPAGWLNHLSEETRNYVPGVINRANSLYPKISDASDYQDSWDKDQFAAAPADEDQQQA
jgi:soluble lytic murein transglycosylase-like protein